MRRKQIVRCVMKNTLLYTIFALALSQSGHAANLYWDADGATAGGSGSTTAAGTWGSSTFWSTSADGDVATTAWAAGNTAVFSAGTDVTGAYTVSLSGSQAAAGVIVEEGTVSFGGTGAASIGAGTVMVNSGATLSIDNAARIAATAGAVFTVDGGTIRNTVGSNAGSFVDADATITLGAGGGTFNFDTVNILNIVQTATVISGTGGLTKTGVGVLGIASASTYAGSTTINGGELRVRGSNNRLPTGTAVTVGGSGIFNLNGLSQTIGTLAGSGEVGLGAGTLTVGGTGTTTFSGIIKDIANAGAGAVTTGSGKLTKSGSGSLTLTGVNTYTGGTTVSAGTLRIGNNSAIGTGLLTITGGTIRTDNTTARTLDNAVTLGGNATVGGTGALTFQTGAWTLTGNRTLTVNNTADTRIASVISQDAAGRSLTKAGTGKLILTAANTYSGFTTVSAGTLALEGSGSLASTNITVNSGATLDVTAGALTLAANQTLKGNGTVLGTVALGAGSVIAPGASAGKLSVGDLTVNGPATYEFEVDAVTGAAGTAWDLIEGTGTLDLNLSELTPWTIEVSGLAAGFDSNQSYTWAIAQFNNVTDFDSDHFVVDTTGFLPSLNGGTFSVDLVGNQTVNLNFAAVPEPSTIALGILGAVGLVAARLRRRS